MPTGINVRFAGARGEAGGSSGFTFAEHGGRGGLFLGLDGRVAFAR